MSVNYHAAQSRGVLFENHEKVSEQWRQEFSQYDPARIKNTLHLETDEEYLYLQYFLNPSVDSPVGGFGATVNGLILGAVPLCLEGVLRPFY